MATVNKILEAGLAPWFALALARAALTIDPAQAQPRSFETFAVPTGSAPHDVAPAPDGVVWYTAQAQGAVGRLDPRSGKIDKIPLGAGSAPHGVIVGPDRAAWVTDGGQNAIVRIDPKTLAITRFPLPKDRPNANLNTAVFDKQGHLWVQMSTARADDWPLLAGCRLMQSGYAARTSQGCDRQHATEGVSKRRLTPLVQKFGFREGPTTAWWRVGKGKVTPQSLQLLCFDTPSTRS